MAKRKYIVTQPNTYDHEVGDEIDLTDEQARQLVNKVRPKDSKPQAGASKKEKQLADQVESLQAQLAERDQIIANLSTELEQARNPDSE